MTNTTTTTNAARETGQNSESKSLDRYVNNRNPDAQHIVCILLELLRDSRKERKPMVKAIYRELEMVIADAAFGCDFGYCANLYEYDAARGFYEGLAGADALSNDQIEAKYQSFSS